MRRVGNWEREFGSKDQGCKVFGVWGANGKGMAESKACLSRSVFVAIVLIMPKHEHRPTASHAMPDPRTTPKDRLAPTLCP